MPSSLASALMMLFTAGAANAALADCAPLIAAFEKANQQPRLARYDLWSRDTQVAGKPVLTGAGATTAAMNIRSDSTGEFLLTSLRDAPAKAGATCDAAVRDKIRGMATKRIRVVYPTAPGETSELTVWIATASGLPLYHEIKGRRTAGVAWVYGNAVRPAVALR